MSTVIARNGAKRNDVAISFVMLVHPDEMVTSSYRLLTMTVLKLRVIEHPPCDVFGYCWSVKSIAYTQVLEIYRSGRERIVRERNILNRL